MRETYVMLTCDNCGTVDYYPSGPDLDGRARENGWIIARDRKDFCDAECRKAFRARQAEKRSG